MKLFKNTHHSIQRYVGGVAILAATYFIVGKAGLMLAFVHPSATAVWPPAGITLAAFLLLGNRIWPGIFLGAFMVNITTAGSFATSLGIALGNTLEGFAGAYLVRMFANGPNAFDRAKDILNFVIAAPILSTTISATIGVTSLALGGFASWTSYGSIWATWWLGDAVGILVIAPMLLLWSVTRFWQWKPKQVVEGILLILALFVAGEAVFGGWLPLEVKTYPLEIINIPVIIWAAFRFDQREIATGIFILSGIALWGTLHGYGPFVGRSPQESLLLLQVFLGITALMAFSAAAVVSERRKLVRDLQDTLAHVKTLTGLLPICAWCKKIRDDKGYWKEVEAYVHEHSDAAFSHGVCPDCLIKYKSEVLRHRRGQ